MENNSSTLHKVSKQLNIPVNELLKKVNFLFPENRPQSSKIHLLDNGILKEYIVECNGIGNIINKFGDFMEYSFKVSDQWEEYSVLIKAKDYNNNRFPIFSGHDYFLVRFDSHCESQMLFGDQTCDCGEQLQMAMKIIAEHGEGAIIHIKKHEGRGKGIASKLDQLSICNLLGIDTVTASLLRAELLEGVNTEIHSPTSIIDSRDFIGCVSILRYFNVPQKIKLLLQTNNPVKKKALSENGYECDFYNISTVPNPINKHHLIAKKTQLNHKLDIADEPTG